MFDRLSALRVTPQLVRPRGCLLAQRYVYDMFVRPTSACPTPGASWPPALISRVAMHQSSHLCDTGLFITYVVLEYTEMSSFYNGCSDFGTLHILKYILAIF